MNNNGVVSFDVPVSQFTPQSFPLGDGQMIIAPYWGDIDTRGTGVVWYGETSDPSLLAQARSDIRAAFINQMFFEPMTLFVAMWDHVGYFFNHTDLVCLSSLYPHYYFLLVVALVNDKSSSDTFNELQTLITSNNQLPSLYNTLELRG